MILASDVFADVKSLLDDDNSGRYSRIKDLHNSNTKTVLNFLLWSLPKINCINKIFQSEKTKCHLISLEIIELTHKSHLFIYFIWFVSECN